MCWVWRTVGVRTIFSMSPLYTLLWAPCEKHALSSQWKPSRTQAAAAAKLLQSCLTLCDPTDGSPPGSPVPGILQARTLEWVGISFSNAWSEKWKWSRSVVSDSQWPHGLQPTRLLCPWDFPGKSTGVGCHCLLWEPRKKHCLSLEPVTSKWVHSLACSSCLVLKIWWWFQGD